MGVVYLVYDVETGSEVALKTLRTWDPTQAYRLKQEFRALADIRHPNLVELYELFTTGAECFFTMELVRGSTIVAHLRATAGNADHLAEVLAQLVHAVAAVHATGRVHRDVKPSNVLVTRSGRVVVLDFGLATAFAGEGATDTVSGVVAGTPAYMAPEQLWGAPPAPPADWYAVGVVLYEALTGRLPFEGPPALMFMAKGGAAPPGPGTHVPEVPARLDALVRALLDPDSRRRPGGDDILRAIQPSGGVPAKPLGVSAPAGQETPFVGRARELAILREAFGTLRGGRAATVLVHGPSGIGKTHLVRRFLADLEGSEDSLALTGRCHPQEAVPYRGFDTLVDQLSRFLLSRPEVEVSVLLPRHTAALTRVFPVLARVPALGSAGVADLEAEPNEIRRRGFAALRELLARIADRWRLVLWIDDTQWAGPDGASLLRELLRPPDAPALMFVLSYRTEDAERAPMLTACRDDLDGASLVEIGVGPLDAAESRELVFALAGTAALDVEAVAEESEGSPFLLTQLARRGGGPIVRLQQVIEDRIRTLSPEARLLLEVVSLAGGPIPRRAALRAAGLGEAERRLVTALQGERLLRLVATEQEPNVETYHDRIREMVIAGLGSAILVSRHRSLAAALEEAGATEPDRLAAHLFGAGEYQRASGYAVAAGDRAAAALAFAHAAAFYRRAREWWPGGPARERDLQVREARALVNAGRCAEAAVLFVAASEGGDPVTALELRQSAAEQFLAGGHFDQGVAVLVPLLEELRLRYPASPRSALICALGRLAQLRLRGTRFRRCAARDVPPGQLVRADVCYSASKSFCIIDPARAVYFSVVGVLLALRTGEPVRVCRSLALVGGSVLTVARGAVGRWGRQLMHQALRLARGEREPYLVGMTAASMGTVHVAAGGAWTRALRSADRGVRLLSDRCRGVSFECAIGRMAAMRALEELGRMVELRARAEDMLASARQAGDLYAEVTAAFYVAFSRLANDDPAGARALARQSLARWSREGFHIQHFSPVRIEVYCDLYEGQPDKARDRLLDIWPALEASFLLRVPISRVDAYLLRARATLALAAHDPGLLPECDRAAARLAREAQPAAVAHATLIRASVAALRGETGLAVQLAVQAAAAYERARMTLQAIYAERRGAELVGGEARRQGVEEADRRARTCGIKDPERWAAVYAPGFRRAAAEA